MYGTLHSSVFVVVIVSYENRSRTFCSFPHEFVEKLRTMARVLSRLSITIKEKNAYQKSNAHEE